MIDRTELLKDLQKVVKDLEKDLLERTESEEVPEVGAWLKSEYQQAKDAERTAHTYKQWLDDFITQVAVAWALSFVFARFLEDNVLVDPPRPHWDGGGEIFLIYVNDFCEEIFASRHVAKSYKIGNTGMNGSFSAR